MGLDIENSIKYPTRDSDLIKKLLIGGFFCLGIVLVDFFNTLTDLIGDEKFGQLKQYVTQTNAMSVAIIIVLFFLALVLLNIFILGYDASNTNLRIFKPSSNLLNWENFGKLFKVGIKSAIGLGSYLVIMGVILGLAFFPALLIIINYKANTLVLVLLGLAMFACTIIVIAMWVVYVIAAELAFFTDLKLKSFFNFSLINKFIIKNFFQFFIFIILTFAVNTLISILNMILMLTVVGIVIIPVLRFYSLLMINDLSAQFIRQTLEMNEENN